MIQPFNAENRGKAIYVGTVTGWVIAWGFSPFWIGHDPGGLEAAQLPGAGVFNFEIRDGFYIANGDGAFSKSDLPVVLPWSGKVYILNGNATNDQPNNVVMIRMVGKCD